MFKENVVYSLHLVSAMQKIKTTLYCDNVLTWPLNSKHKNPWHFFCKLEWSETLENTPGLFFTPVSLCISMKNHNNHNEIISFVKRRCYAQVLVVLEKRISKITSSCLEVLPMTWRERLVVLESTCFQGILYRVMS